MEKDLTFKFDLCVYQQIRVCPFPWQVKAYDQTRIAYFIELGRFDLEEYGRG